MSGDPATDPIPPPAVARRRRWLPSLIWLIPIVAALVGVTLVARILMDRGPVITLVFNSAEGLEAGKTRLKYKDVDIGTVRAINLAEDRSHVRVTVQLLKEARSFTAADTRFWVVRPRADFSGISGLGTLLSGAYIGADAGLSRDVSTYFKGLEAPPIVTRDASGRQFTLHARDIGSLDIGSPVYYRRVKVGQVAAYSLDPDGRGVTLRVFVNSPHDRYVGANTRFWHASGIDVQLDVVGRLPFAVRQSAQLKRMDLAYFGPDKIGLTRLGRKPVSERVRFEECSNTLFLNLEGLEFHQADQVEAFEAELTPFLNFQGKVRAVINYDRFQLGEGAAAAWFQLVERNNEKYFSHSLRVTSNTLFCRKMGDEFARRQVPLKQGPRGG